MSQNEHNLYTQFAIRFAGYTVKYIIMAIALTLLAAVVVAVAMWPMIYFSLEYGSAATASEVGPRVMHGVTFGQMAWWVLLGIAVKAWNDARKAYNREKRQRASE